MASISTRTTVLAIKAEVTEGTPVSPGATTDYTALQDDFDMSPSFETLENAEIRSSLGAAAPILGTENPTCSFSHYIRASGTAGVAPDYNELLKTFFGTETANGTERTLAASSTVSLLKAAAGGSDFARGCGVLIKDSTNGYRIRVSDGNSSNDVPLSFDLPAAPAVGVTLGKCVYYSPANSGHQTICLWNYVGNGGAIQLLAGGRVTEFTMTAEAGQLINGSFTIEGTAFYLNPIEITSSTRYLDFEDDNGTVAAVVSTGWYKDPHELASALQTAMRAVSAATAVVTYSDTTGKFNIRTSGTLLTLEWNTGANTANTIGTKLGFSVAADDSGTAATTGYTSDNAYVTASPYTPALDSADPLAAKYQEVMVGESTDYVCFEASSVSFSGSNTKRNIASICAQSGISGSVISERSGTINVTALLSQYEADKFRMFREGAEIKFQYSFGVKTGGNWVAGKCGYVYSPTCKISSYKISNDDGLATLELELTPFVNSSGEGEMFLGFL